MPNIPLTRSFRMGWLQADLFTNWLALHEEDIVGFSTVPSECPIAQYLRVHFPLPTNYSWLVFDSYIDIVIATNWTGYVCRFDTPDWARKVIKEVDKKPFGSMLIGRDLLALKIQEVKTNVVSHQAA